MKASVAILGGGRLARAIGAILGETGADLRLWARRKAARTSLQKALPLSVVGSVAEACAGAQIVVFAVPASALREVAEAYGEVATGDQMVLHATRGVDAGFVLPHRVLRQETCVRKVGVLGGPLHFKELGAGRPIAAVLATRFDDTFVAAQRLLGGGPVHLHRSRDVLGVEVAGVVSNISALAVGLCDGVGLGDTARGVLLTRGLIEATRLGVALGAERATFSGLAGVGDLIPRKVASTERHHKVGSAIAHGASLEEALAGVRGEVEGVAAAEEAAKLAERLGLDLPLIQAVDMLLHGEADPKPTLEEILQLDLTLG